MIELNADIGEGCADAVLMPYVDRVSIACGGHAGDEVSMRAALHLAQKYGVQAGAHPSYPDPANFGRSPMEATPEQIAAWVLEQVRVLQVVAHSMGMSLFHVKPHGALYNTAAFDEAAGQGLIAAILELKHLSLVALAGSNLARLARRAGIEVLEEAFADRRYLTSGALAPRHQEGAVIRGHEAAAAQALAIARQEAISTLDGGNLLVSAQTICLHGDNEGAADRARFVARALGKLV